MGVGAAIGVGALGSLISSGIGAFTASGAAGTQANSSNLSAQIQLAEFNKIQQQLKPYITTGSSATNSLASLTGTNPGGNPLTSALTKPFGTPYPANFSYGPQSPGAFNYTGTQAPGAFNYTGAAAPGQFSFNPSDLADTPGYQFALDQGLKATQNGYAAQGLGSSGAAMKGAANYAEGLASTTYQQQYQNALGSYQENLSNYQQQYGNQLGAYSSGLQNYQQQYANQLGGYSANLAGYQQGFGNALSSYGTNIANYQQQFQNYLGQNQQIYNLLAGQSQLGENAAVGAGGIGTTTSANIGNAIVGSGQATAAGQVGVGNALAGGLNSLGSYALLGNYMSHP